MRTFPSLLASALLVMALVLASACEGDGGGNGLGDATGGGDVSSTDGQGGEDLGPGGDTGLDCTGTCGARTCGPNPTAGCPACGTCGAGSTCDNLAGQCVADPCDCGARECGAHPSAACAGTSCGTCDVAGEVCNITSGECIPCTPECGTRECGPDPACESSCGECEGENEFCNDDGMCEACVSGCGARECGPDPDGCVLSCGECDPNEECTAAGACVVVEVSGFGGYCLESETCHGELTSGDAATPTYPDCLDLKCETGECWGWWCTKACTPEKDEVNNLTLAPTPDGVEDADSASTQCAGSADDAFAGPFRCVNLQQPTPGTQPVAFCFAGTDFRPCDANADCTAGESCQVMLVAGVLSTFCLQAPQNAVGIAEECNSSPLEGDVAFCETDLCFGVGCTEFCESDEDCGTYTQGCDGNTCADDPQIECATDADCSAWTCVRDLPIFSNDPTLFDVCLGRECFANDGCRDSDFYCRLFGNFEDGMDPADFKWEPACEKRPEGSVDVGEACDEDPTVPPEGPVCHSDFCIAGYCSAFCTADDDCALDLGQRCVVYEWPLDLDDDGEDDHFEPIGLCYTIGNIDADSTACTSQADCAAGETCSILQIGDYSPGEGGETDISGVCKTDAAEDLGYFAACGLEDDQHCAGEGWLFQCFESNPDEGIPGYCSYPCRTSADCPAGVDFDGTTPLKGVCGTLYYGYNGTYDPEDPATQVDDLFINFCEPEVDLSSLADCSADFTCADENEACLPNQIIYGPTTVPVVEWLCREAFDAENPRPTGAPGDACTDGGDCASLYCNNPTEAEGAGYCSLFCNGDGDCAAIDGATCVQDVWFDRADDQYDLIVPNCQVAAE